MTFPSERTNAAPPTGRHTRFYRDKINGRFLGVCSGIADYTGIDVMWVRIAAIALTVCGMGFLPLLYFLIGMMAPAKPAHLYADSAEQRFWQGVRQSPGRTAREVRAKFRDIDHRLAEVESFYVSSNPRLSAEIERLR
ncbi:MAG: envelope stress response membrane protein PspC [Sphingomonadales bacterium]|nr:envelope stress response membrane protein PspC [Sphingomonadales bacterium]MBU3992184.1 envelope stress response membrane protein PspC [Alphaproteobacteria bacterium]